MVGEGRVDTTARFFNDAFVKPLPAPNNRFLRWEKMIRSTESMQGIARSSCPFRNCDLTSTGFAHAGFDVGGGLRSHGLVRTSSHPRWLLGWAL